MELNNLKEMWSKEQISETPEISLEKQKEIHLHWHLQQSISINLKILMILTVMMLEMLR